MSSRTIAFALFALNNASIVQASFLCPNHRTTTTCIMSTKSATANDKPAQEWDVDRYQQQHSFVWQCGADLVKLANIQPNERVLDVGCGTGELTNELSSSSNNVMGLDADPNVIAKAKQQFPHLQFLQADVRQFELKEEPVDVIFSNAALHWVGNDNDAAERAVACMARALKPGGRFVVEFGGKGNVDTIVRAAQQVLQTSDCPWYFPSIAEFTSLLERHAIEVTTALMIDRPTLLEGGEEGLRNWLLMFGNKFYESMSQDEIKQVLIRVKELVRPQLFNGTNWTADYRRIRIIGHKCEWNKESK